MKSHFDVLDFCLAVFLFSVLASGAFSFSVTTSGISSSQTALVVEGNTGSPAGNTGSPGIIVGAKPTSSNVQMVGGAKPTNGTSKMLEGARPSGGTGSPSGGNVGTSGGNVGSPGSDESVKDISTVKTGTRYGTAADCKQNIVPKGTLRYPTGIALDDAGNPKLQIIVDPDFNAKMNRERNTPDLPVAPIYDLIVEAVPAFDACYTDSPEKFGTEPPKALTFPVSIKLRDETLVGPGTLALSNRKSDDGRLLYEWKLKGWQNGIAPEEKLEKLIKAVQEKNPNLKTVVEVKQKDGSVESETSGADFGLCAPLWGNGEHKFVYERGESAALNVPTLIKLTEDVRTGGFEQIEPFKKYKKEFSHVVDLINIDDHAIDLFQKIYQKSALSPSEIVDTIIGVGSSCRPSLGEKSYNYVLRSGLSSVSIIGIGGVDGIASENGSGAIVSPLAPAEAVMHETGHFFAGLVDEDDGGTGLLSPKFVYKLGKLGQRVARNCSWSPLSDFTYEGKLYADKPDENVEGCGHILGVYDIDPNEPRPGYRIKNSTRVHRPSPNSIMNYRKEGAAPENRFNVISYGYIAAAIKGGSGPEYWPEGMASDGVIKPTKVASTPPSTLLASIFPLVNPLSVNQVSTVASAIPSSQNRFLIFERLELPAGGVIWEDGQPMPPSLKIGLAASSASTDVSSKLGVRKSTSRAQVGQGDTKTTTTTTATTTISFANSLFIKPQTVAVGTTTTIGGFAVSVAGEPVSVKNFRFRVTVGGGPGSLSDLKGVGLYGPTGELISEGVVQSDETILFTKTFTILTAQNTYVIKAVLGPRFKAGQTIQLYANFYKDDAIFTGTKSGKNVAVPKNTLNLSQMTIAS